MSANGPLGTERAHRRDRLEIADIFRDHGETFRQRHDLTEQERRVMAAICACRTSVLGGYVEVCDRCGHFEISYNSCLMGSVWLWGVAGRKCLVVYLAPVGKD